MVIQIGGQTYLDNTRLRTVCNSTCVCRQGNIQCTCEQKSLRRSEYYKFRIDNILDNGISFISCREIRRLTTEDRKSFQNAVRKLKMTETGQGQNVWDSMRDKYMRSIPIAQVCINATKLARNMYVLYC